MFDELIRALNEMKDTMNVPVSIPLDDDGYFDRRCPNQQCHAEFKVLFEDWGSKVQETGVFCPMCREVAPATEWNTSAQWTYFKTAAMNHFQDRFNASMSRAAARTKPASKGFLTISLSYRPGTPLVVVPIEAADSMRLKVTCELCLCRYASIGAAFFCPACGHNSAPSTFGVSVETVRRNISQLHVIRTAVEGATDADGAEDTVRQITESGLERLVASFQRLAEATFSALHNSSQFKVRRNAFQNVKDGSDVWLNATGAGYEKILTPAELGEMTRLFQQRHLLAHREGVVDQEYIDKSRDLSWKLGQRLVVRPADVLLLADLVSRVSALFPRS